MRGLDNYLASEGELASFGGDEFTCEMCGDRLYGDDVDEGICTSCVCKVDTNASEFFSAPLWLIQDRMREYCDKYNWTFEKKGE